MPTLRYTSHLQKFFPTLEQGSPVEGQTVAEVVTALERQHPGLAAYIVDERGALRQHVNIFIGDTMISDRQRLSDPVAPSAQVYIFQALSGG
jgi:hypothetical protein